MAKKGEARVTFVAETKEFTQGIAQINKSLANLRSDLKLCNTELKANGDSFEALTKKQEALQNALTENGSKIELLRKKLDKCKDTLGENSDEYNKLYRQLNKAQTEQIQFQNELKDTEQRLDSLNDELKETGDGLEDFSDSTSDLGDELGGVLPKGFNLASLGATALKGALIGLAIEGIKACIQAIGEFCQYLWELPEATAEFRMQMAKLEGSTTQYGYSLKDTNELVKEMYGYFGDEQMAVNAITNLQGLNLEQSELTETLNNCVAVWTAYGDSIPVESLTESVNETAQVGKVTGVLADALNWAGVSEDEFNKKLEACGSTEERVKLINDTLNESYSESKKVYDENTESLRGLREEQYNTMTAEAKLAETIEPLKTRWEDFKNTLLEAALPAIEAICDALMKFMDWCEKCGQKIQDLTQTQTWQTLEDIGGVALDLFITKMQVLWETLLILWEGVQIAWEGFKLLWDILSQLAIACSPFYDKIVELCGGFQTATGETQPLIEALQRARAKMAEVKETVREVCDNIRAKFDELKNGTTSVWSMITTALSNAWNSIKSTASSAVSNVKTTVSNAWNSIKTTASNAWNGIKTTISNAWNSIKSTISNAINSVKSTASNGFNSIKTTATNAWNSIKSSASSAWNGIKSTVSSAVSGIKSTVSSAFSGISSTITSAFSKAKSAVTSALSSIKGSLSGFKPSWSIPKPKLPKISVSTSTKSIGGISIPIPSFSVSWGWKGGIIGSPTIFPTANGLVGVGDRYNGMGSNAEAIIPLDSFYSHLDDKIDSIASGNIVINMKDFHIHDNLDVNELAENLAFQVQRKMGFR